MIIDGRKIKLHFHLGGDYKVSTQTEFDNSLWLNCGRISLL